MVAVTMITKQQGISLIELVCFISVVGLIMSSVTLGLNKILSQITVPDKMSKAIFLANARMEAILLSRAVNGFTGLSDPCASGSLAFCSKLASFATANGYTVSTLLSTSGQNTSIKVQVSGAAGATLYSQVSNYQ